VWLVRLVRTLLGSIIRYFNSIQISCIDSMPMAAPSFVSMPILPILLTQCWYLFSFFGDLNFHGLLFFLMDMSCSYKKPTLVFFLFVEPDLIWVDVRLAFHEGFSLLFIFNSWCLSGFTTSLVLLYWVAAFFFFLDFSSFFAFNGCIRWLFLSIFFVFIQGLSGTTFFELFSVSVFL